MKHTRHSIRLPSYDYTSSGAYYVTICTKNRQHFFREIRNVKMNLSKIGKTASQNWQDISNHYDHVELGEFVVMPNHIHGIIWIVGVHPDLTDKNEIVGTSLGMTDDENMNAWIRRGEPLHKREFGAPQSGSLSMIINHFKGSVKR